MTDLLTTTEQLQPGLWRLPGLVDSHTVFSAIQAVATAAPFRFMETPGGRPLSVAMTNCGPLGWVTARGGYRYSAVDPLSGEPWPALPPLFAAVAHTAATIAGFPDFQPDACLINRYEPGTRLGLHQDRDEASFDHPIVSVSLGLAAVFLWRGTARRGPVQRLTVNNGDVLVWGGVQRLAYHGIAPLAAGQHPVTGGYRYNLTLRRAGG